MAKIFIALHEKDYQRLLKEWMGDRNDCFIALLDDPNWLKGKILNMDYDLAFVDEILIDEFRETIKERKLKEYPVILPFVYIKTSSVDEEISEIWDIVDELLRPPLKKLEVYMRSQRLLNYRKITRMLNYTAVTDPVSGFFAYNYLMIIGEQEFEQSKRYERPLSIMFMYIDQISKIKSTYKNSVIDKLIRRIAQRCYLKIRSADIPGRYSSNKFLFIMPETPGNCAVLTAERLRRIVSERPTPINGYNIFVTASFGVASLDERVHNFSDLISRAEKALFKAKENGGNRVELYIDEED